MTTRLDDGRPRKKSDFERWMELARSPIWSGLSEEAKKVATFVLTYEPYPHEIAEDTTRLDLLLKQTALSQADVEKTLEELVKARCLTRKDVSGLKRILSPRPLCIFPVHQ